MSSAETDALDAEMRARRTLGLRTDTPRLQQQRPQPGRQRHRFVQDGEVPVVIVRDSGRSIQSGHRIAELVAALDAERAARAAAMHSLEEARTIIQSLQTRLAHTELVCDEAVAAERQARIVAERALQQVVAGDRAAEDRLELAAEGAPAQAPGKRPRATRTVSSVRDAATRPKTREPQPIRWWLPSYRARTRRD
jgi:hypothetical protein